MLGGIKEVFKTALKVDQSKISEETTMDNLFEWDSLHHLAIIVGLEKKFKIKLKPSDVAKMNSVKKILEVLNEKAEKKAS